jgi:hypothetical protein
MQIRVMICVRSIGVTPSTEAEDRESAAAHASVVADPARHAATDRARGHTGRATRLHAHTGSRGTRDQPLHLQPARATPDRDARDALGRAADSDRRAAAAARRKAAAGPKAGATRATRPARRTRTGSGGPDPQRARRREEPCPNRARAQRHRNTNSPRRRPVVAIYRTRCAPPHGTLTAHSPLTGCVRFPIACQRRRIPSIRLSSVRAGSRRALRGSRGPVGGRGSDRSLQSADERNRPWRACDGWSNLRRLGHPHLSNRRPSRCSIHRYRRCPGIAASTAPVRGNTP